MATELTPKQQLQAMLELLSERSHWTQDALARNAQGRRMENPLGKTATCWCAEGALRKVCGLSQHDFIDGKPAWRALNRTAFPMSVFGVNDNEGYEAVLEMITRAMEYV